MSVLDNLLSVIAPHSCEMCGTEGAVLCRSCALSVPDLPSICYVCARATKNYSPCKEHTRQFSPSAVYIATAYEGAVKAALRTYKFDCRRAASKDLAFLLSLVLPHLSEQTVISYVPATGQHVRQRGFHHTKLLAQQLSWITSRRYAETLLRITSVTQKGANLQTRKKQLKGAFRPLPANIKDQNILLVDDVITTGATINECCRQLWLAGASDVRVAVVARTP